MALRSEVTTLWSGERLRFPVFLSRAPLLIRSTVIWQPAPARPHTGLCACLSGRAPACCCWEAFPRWSCISGALSYFDSHLARNGLYLASLPPSLLPGICRSLLSVLSAEWCSYSVDRR